MALGDGAKSAVQSYTAVGRELTFGTYPTATSVFAFEALTCSFRTDIKSEKIDSLSTNRGFVRRVQLDKEVAGTVEQYLHPLESVVMFAAALGGGLTTTTASSASTHILKAGNFDDTIASVSFNVRKGNEHVWHYSGGRVNQLKLTGEVGSPVKVSYDFIFKDSTQLADDISASLSISSVLPFTYAQGVFKYSGTAECITGFELTINNNLKSDKDARCLGSNVLSVLPATRRNIEFKINQRFDTTTTLSRFTDATNAAVQLTFTGATFVTGTSYTCQIDLAKVYQNSPDVELGGTGDVLVSEIAYDCLVDNPHTSTGYDIKVTFINNVTAY